MHWKDVEDDEPALAELGRDRLTKPGVVLVGTLRCDGAPRISPVEPLLWDGDLWLSMLLGSRKAADLHHDPRLLVHSIVTSREGTAGEYKVRGHAVGVDDAAVQAGYAREVRDRLGWKPVHGSFHLFQVEISDISFIRYDDSTGDQFVTRWPNKTEFVRRGTTATSLGPPQPHRQYLTPR